jgi:AcrR family transcriptional regulator
MPGDVLPSTPAAPRAGRRPRNRRALILSAASELFVQHGYPAVTMADIARAVSVQPSALYRHFPSKQDLLHQAVAAAIEPGVRILADTTAAELDQTLARLAEEAVDNRNLGVLWQRESYNLPPAVRTELRSHVREAMHSLRTAILQRRHDLDLHQAEFMAWCVFAVLISVGYQKADIPRADQTRMLRRLTMNLISMQVPRLVPTEEKQEPAFGLGARREVLLSLGMTLFSARGYEAVSVDDIADAAGIATPSFYHHFNSKSDLLWTSLTRANEAMRTQMTRSLRHASDATDALQRVMASYIDLALDCPEVIEALLAQVAHLQPPERQRARELQVDLLGEWLALLHQAHPGLDRPAARLFMQAALTLVNDVVRTKHLRDLDGVSYALQVAAWTVLL